MPDKLIHVPKEAHVYILTSGFKHLYIGVTTRLDSRIAEHKQHLYPGCFTAQYNITQLVYLEHFDLVSSAIAREKQLKRWSRIKKVRLIVAANPSWQDLSADWSTLIPPPL